MNKLTTEFEMIEKKRSKLIDKVEDEMTWSKKIKLDSWKKNQP